MSTNMRIDALTDRVANLEKANDKLKRVVKTQPIQVDDFETEFLCPLCSQYIVDSEAKRLMSFLIAGNIQKQVCPNGTIVCKDHGTSRRGYRCTRCDETFIRISDFVEHVHKDFFVQVYPVQTLEDFFRELKE